MGVDSYVSNIHPFRILRNLDNLCSECTWSLTCKCLLTLNFPRFRLYKWMRCFKSAWECSFHQEWLEQLHVNEKFYKKEVQILAPKMLVKIKVSWVQITFFLEEYQDKIRVKNTVFSIFQDDPLPLFCSMKEFRDILWDFRKEEVQLQLEWCQ